MGLLNLFKKHRELKENYEMIIKAYTRGRCNENANVIDIITEGQVAQSRYYNNIIKRDMNAMIEQDLSIEEIKDYLKDPFIS